MTSARRCLLRFPTSQFVICCLYWPTKPLVCPRHCPRRQTLRFPRLASFFVHHPRTRPRRIVNADNAAQAPVSLRRRSVSMFPPSPICLCPPPFFHTIAAVAAVHRATTPTVVLPFRRRHSPCAEANVAAVHRATTATVTISSIAQATHLVLIAVPPSTPPLRHRGADFSRLLERLSIEEPGECGWTMMATANIGAYMS